MKKFDSWNNIKKEINFNKSGKFYHEREIWWCSIGCNVGFEQDGSEDDFMRPVLIIKSLSRNTCIILPLTTSDKFHHYRMDIGVVGEKISKVIVSQIKVIDTRRLINRFFILDKITFSIIRKAVKDLF